MSFGRVLTVSLLSVVLAGCVANTKLYENALNDPTVNGEKTEAAKDPDGDSEFLDDRQVATLSPQSRPPLDSQEAGLWMMMDKSEKALKTSGSLITDEVLNDYIREVVCNLAGRYCPDFRTYLVRIPHFNATMSPNGVMQVWSGLLLRMRNEAQLAAVLGHEIGHYLRRHSYQRFKDQIEKSNALVFFGLATSIMGVPGAGDIANLIAAGSISAFSRDHEREADGYGLVLLTKSGYDPREASKVWEQVIEETADEGKNSSLIAASHPPSEERMVSLSRLATKLTKNTATPLKTSRGRYLSMIAPFRKRLLHDELKLRNHKHFEKLLTMLIDDGIDPPLHQYFLGESYRLRNEKGDLEKAIEHYKKASATEFYPYELHRSMGLVFRKQGNKTEARNQFEKYLTLNSDAKDKNMIKRLIHRLK